MFKWLRKPESPEKKPETKQDDSPKLALPKHAMTGRECEVNIKFNIPPAKLKHIYRAASELSKAGVKFDTGGVVGSNPVEYDWFFDWSLKGAKVIFERFRENEGNED